jgi:hypothetical protein
MDDVSDLYIQYCEVEEGGDEDSYLVDKFAGKSLGSYLLSSDAVKADQNSFCRECMACHEQH